MYNEQVETLADQREGGEASCLHYWLIEPANGPFSAGTCRNCGEHRTLKNNLDTFDFNPHPSQSAPDVGGGEPC